MKDDALTEGIAGGAEIKEYSRPTGSEWKDKRFNLRLGYSFWLSAVPVRMFTGCGLPSSVGFSDCGKLYRCSMMMQQHTNMLFYHSHGVDKPLTVEKLATRLGINPQRCYKFVQHMVDLRVMILTNTAENDVMAQEVSRVTDNLIAGRRYNNIKVRMPFKV